MLKHVRKPIELVSDTRLKQALYNSFEREKNSAVLFDVKKRVKEETQCEPHKGSG